MSDETLNLYLSTRDCIKRKRIDFEKESENPPITLKKMKEIDPNWNYSKEIQLIDEEAKEQEVLKINL